MNFSRLLSLAAVSVLIAGGFSNQSLFARPWTQAASGKTIEADFVKVENGVVHLKMANGTIGQVPVASLSAADQQFIADATKPAPAWPNFRGPNHDGISPDTGLLKEWPEGGPKKLWSYSDAGNGYGTVSIANGKVFTSGTRESDVVVICLNDENGDELWSTKISEDDKNGYSAGWGHGPRATPTYSDGLVYALGPKGTLACLNAEDGKVVWKSHMKDNFGGQNGGWGYSASPFIDGEKLIIAPGGNKAGIVALDKKTGDVLWEATEVTPGKAEYANIVPATINDIPQYIRLFEKEIVSVNAETGKVVWRSPWDGATAVIPTPIVQGNQVFLGSGYGKGCKLIEIDSNNNASDVWQNKVMKNHHGGFIHVDGHIYGFSDGPGLICQNWESGEMVWNSDDGQYLSKGSIAIADGMIYALNEQNGAVSLVEVDPKSCNVKGRFTLDPQTEIRSPQGKVWSHPVIINGKLYLRDQDLIHCYDVKG